jgi:hypothetical protein
MVELMYDGVSDQATDDESLSIISNIARVTCSGCGQGNWATSTTSWIEFLGDDTVTVTFEFKRKKIIGIPYP